MRNAIRGSIFGLLLLCACFTARVADASIITATVGGQIDRSRDWFDPDREIFVPYNLGIEVDDVFSGSFSYDSETGAPLHFIAEIGGRIFQADNLNIRVQLFDTFFNWFAIRGEIGNGKYMAVGLTAGTPVFGNDPPEALISDDFVNSGFQINYDGGIPIEVNVAPLGVIGAYNRFWVTTVPEPATWWMMLTALAVAVRLKMRPR